jgi:hypothetical protein
MKNKIYRILIVLVHCLGLCSCSKTTTVDKSYNLFSSYYVRMSDGVQIAVSVFLPKDLTTDKKIPAVIELTRYWRDFKYRFMPLHRDEYTRSGFAHIKIDSRGTGASEGTWTALSKREIKDYYEVIDWVITRRWSNGEVCPTGTSYMGITALLVAGTGHPAIKSMSYSFSPLVDYYNDSFAPGGIFNKKYNKLYSDLCQLADSNNTKFMLIPDPKIGSILRFFVTGMSPVNGDKSKEKLKQILEQRKKNPVSFYDDFSKIRNKDDVVMTAAGPTTIEKMSGYYYLNKIEKSQIPIINFGGWYDINGIYTALNVFNTISNKMHLIIGPWGHNLLHHVSPYLPEKTKPKMKMKQMQDEISSFFSSALSSKDEITKKIKYYTFGEEQWKTTTVWPPAGMEYKQYYFNDGNHLSQKKPFKNNGVDKYKINFHASASSGDKSRYFFGTTDTIYMDRAEEDLKLLCYTSEPLSEDVEITGTPIISLYVSSTHDDGAFYVYLEDVTEQDKVIYVTEGMLRAQHRKISTEKSPLYQDSGIYRTFRKKDRMPLVPGKITELKFHLNPISVLIKKGHRIRIAIAGHDNSVFERIPETGDPVINVYRNAVYRSKIELPVIKHNK